MCSYTSCFVEAFLYLTLLLQNSIDIFMLAVKMLGWLTPLSKLFSPSWRGEALSSLLREPEEHSSVWICSLGTAIEQGEQHKGQPTAKLLAFCTAHNFSSLLDLLL